MVYDYVFVYENKNRELENICLLSNELNKRGYTTYLVETWHNVLNFEKRINAKVVIAFACYNNETYDFIVSHVKKCEKLINLQWEQVISDFQENNENNIYYFDGIAKNVVHISWGIENYNKLINKFRINKENVYIAGRLDIDFLNGNLKKYYKSKNEIKKEYNIPRNKKIYLFISSFSYVNIPNKLLDEYSDNFYDIKQFQKNQINSQKAILEWFKKELNKNPDVVLIYRPHPAEVCNEFLNNFVKETSNIKLLQDYSVQNWILVADKIYTNYSTSVLQIYAAHKTCSILRPYAINKKDDVSIYKDCSSINSYKEFSKSFNCFDIDFPIDKELINRVCLVDKKRKTYKMIADVCERVLKNKEYNVPYRSNNIKSIIFDTKKLIKKGIFVLYQNNFIKLERIKSEKIKKILEFSIYADKMSKKNYSTKEEINIIKEKINKYI